MDDLEVITRFGTPVTGYGEEEFQRFLEQHDMLDLEIALDSYPWQGYETKKQMVHDELLRRLDAEERDNTAAQAREVLRRYPVKAETPPEERAPAIPPINRGWLRRFWRVDWKWIVGILLSIAGIIVTVVLAQREPAIPFSSEPNSPTVSVQAETQEFGPSLAEVLTTLADEKLTDLQKSQFVRRHEGRTVRWKGIVKQVKRFNESQDDSDIYVIFWPPDDDDIELRESILASFPSTAEPDLAPLSSGDVVVLQGTLNFLFEPPHSVPSLEECRLISFSKAQ